MTLATKNTKKQYSTGLLVFDNTSKKILIDLLIDWDVLNDPSWTELIQKNKQKSISLKGYVCEKDHPMIVELPLDDKHFVRWIRNHVDDYQFDFELQLGDNLIKNCKKVIRK